MNENIFRGTGRTTQQMLNAPLNAVFVWVNHNLFYPKKLAQQHGRQDLKIVGPTWLEERFLGQQISGLIIDHAAYEFMTQQQYDNIPYALARIR